MTAKKFLESKGYEFLDKDFWMEDYVTEHKFRDLIQLMEDYSNNESQMKQSIIDGQRKKLSEQYDEIIELKSRVAAFNSNASANTNQEK